MRRTAIGGSRFQNLIQGQALEFEIVDGQKGPPEVVQSAAVAIPTRIYTYILTRTFAYALLTYTAVVPGGGPSSRPHSLICGG